MIIASNFKSKKLFYKCLIIVICVIIIFALGFLIMKYEVEGENANKMPFKLSMVTVASTADGTRKESEDELWNVDVFQVNDVYLKIEKNTEKAEILKSLSINNIKILQSPQKGVLKTTQILKAENGLNRYTDSEVQELVYSAGQTTNLENLTIANQGGTVGIRFIIDDLVNYNEEDDEITYDGTLLAKSNISIEEIKFVVSFDLTIELENKIKYKGTLVMELPEENILEDGMNVKEFSNLEEIVFKRV